MKGSPPKRRSVLTGGPRDVSAGWTVRRHLRPVGHRSPAWVRPGGRLAGVLAFRVQLADRVLPDQHPLRHLPRRAWPRPRPGFPLLPPLLPHPPYRGRLGTDETPGQLPVAAPRDHGMFTATNLPSLSPTAASPCPRSRSGGWSPTSPTALHAGSRRALRHLRRHPRRPHRHQSRKRRTAPHCHRRHQPGGPDRADQAQARLDPPRPMSPLSPERYERNHIRDCARCGRRAAKAANWSAHGFQVPPPASGRPWPPHPPGRGDLRPHHRRARPRQSAPLCPLTAAESLHRASAPTL